MIRSGANEREEEHIYRLTFDLGCECEINTCFSKALLKNTHLLTLINNGMGYTRPLKFFYLVLGQG